MIGRAERNAYSKCSSSPGTTSSTACSGIIGGPHCGGGLDRFGLEACGGHAAPIDPAQWDSPAAVPAGRCILAARVRLPPGRGGGRLPVLLRSVHRYPTSRAMSYLPELAIKPSPYPLTASFNSSSAALASTLRI